MCYIHCIIGLLVPISKTDKNTIVLPANSVCTLQALQPIKITAYVIHAPDPSWSENQTGHSQNKQQSITAPLPDH